MTGDKPRDVHWPTFFTLWVALVLVTMVTAWSLGWQIPMEPVALVWAMALTLFLNPHRRGATASATQPRPLATPAAFAQARE